MKTVDVVTDLEDALEEAQSSDPDWALVQGETLGALEVMEESKQTDPLRSPDSIRQDNYAGYGQVDPGCFGKARSRREDDELPMESDT